MFKLTRRDLLKITGAYGTAYALPSFAQENYPNRPVNLVVAYSAGGQNDLTARLVTQPLAGYWGQPVIIDNRPGAGGAIGAQIIAKANPDGYNLLFMAVNHVILSSFKTDLPYNPERDFSPVSLVATFPIVLIVNPSLPFKTTKEFIAYAKTHPGEITFGSSGVGGGGHLAAELFAAKTGIKMLHVAYKGDAPALTDLMGGQISCMFCSAASALPYIKSNKVRVLGISSKQRSSLLPDTPTIAESGVADYEANSWVGIVAPNGTPDAIINKINQNITRSLNDPLVKSKVADIGGEVQPGTPQQFRDFIRSEKKKWTNLIKSSNLNLE